MAQLTVVERATLVTLDTSLTIIEDGELWIEGETIVAACKPGEFVPPENARISRFDGSSKIAMPGFVNAHMHSYAGLLKGTVDAIPLDVFMINAIAGAGTREPRDVYVSAQIGCLEMLTTGTTACLDHFSHRPSHTPDVLDTVLQAYADAGMRAAVAPMFSDLPFVDTVPFDEDMPSADICAFLPKAPVPHEPYFDMMTGALEKWRDHPRVSLMLGIDSPQRCSDELLRRGGAFCADQGIGNHTHLLEARTQWAMATTRDPRGFVAYLAECGLAGPLSSFAHFVWCSDADIEALVTAGATVVHNPSSNLVLGSGIQPLIKLVEAGVPVALGSDGLNAGHAVMFEKARLAALLNRVTEPDSDRWLQAGPVLRMATNNGARALGAQGERGYLAAGQAADIVLLDSESLSMSPMGEPHRQIVHYETGGSVTDVFVAGKQVIANGASTRIDGPAILAEAREIAARLSRDNRELLKKAEAMYPNIKSMVARVHAMDCGPCRFAKL
ncbi:MAG: amidohydrolase family protein [Granulosicoccus sp.]